MKREEFKKKISRIPILPKSKQHCQGLTSPGFFEPPFKKYNCYL